MLRKLNAEYPGYVPVIVALARIEMELGQYDEALKLLRKAESIDNENQKTICLLAEYYEMSHNKLVDTSQNDHWRITSDDDIQ